MLVKLKEGSDASWWKVVCGEKDRKERTRLRGKEKIGGKNQLS